MAHNPPGQKPLGVDHSTHLTKLSNLKLKIRRSTFQNFFIVPLCRVMSDLNPIFYFCIRSRNDGFLGLKIALIQK